MVHCMVQLIRVMAFLLKKKKKKKKEEEITPLSLSNSRVCLPCGFLVLLQRDFKQ